MPTYAYRAVDAAGARHRGRVEAANPAALGAALEARGLILLDASPAGNGAAAARGPGGWTGRRRSVLEVTRALAALLPAGLPLARALSAATHVAGGEIARALPEIRERVERGDGVAAALADHPRLFPPLYVGMVRAGERSGDLAGAFRRLADQLEREEALRGRLLSASLYPMILAGVGGIAVVVLLLFVLPRFVELLEGTGAELPRSTALLLGLSVGARRLGPLLVFVPVAGALFAAAYAGTEAGRRVAARLLLRLPIVRGLRQGALAARFARLVSVLLGGGAPLFSALGDAAESLGDPVARDEAVRVRGRLREGASLHQALTEGALFPPLLGQLIAVGEEAGRLEEFLAKAADLFEDRTERTLARLVTLVEPAMIVGFGAIVAFVALSLLQAIYGVNAGAFR